MWNDSKRLSFEDQNLTKTEKGQHEKLIIGMPNLHRRQFQRGTPFMLSKGSLPPEKAFIRDEKQDSCETCSPELETAVTGSMFCCKLLLYSLKALGKFVP